MNVAWSFKEVRAKYGITYNDKHTAQEEYAEGGLMIEFGEFGINYMQVRSKATAK